MSMPPPTSRQDDFQLRLAQWLLDQLNSRTELETVTQQISLLISQVQGKSIEDIYVHIGQLMFRKADQIQLQGPESHIRLYAELCYSLSMLHFRQRSSLSPRVTLIHEHLFRLCVDSLSAENYIESVSTLSPKDDHGTLVQTSSELLFNLWDFQLVSLVQICEYIFRVIEVHKTSIGPKLADAVIGVRSLLDPCFSRHSHSPWKSEADTFHEWVDTHSGWNENGDNTTGVSGYGPNREPVAVGEAEDTIIKYQSSSSSSNDTCGPSANLIDSSTPLDETESQINEEENMENMSGNNFGSPPQIPSTNTSNTSAPTLSSGLSLSPSRRLGPGSNDHKSPVPPPPRPQIGGPPLPGPSASDDQRLAGSPRMSADTPPQHQRPMVHPHQYHPPHPDHPLPQRKQPAVHQPPMQPSPETQPTQPRTPSTSPAPNTSPHPLPPITTTRQAPPSVASLPLSPNPPTFIPGGLRRSANPVQISAPNGDALAFEGQIPPSPKVTTPVPPKRRSVVVRVVRVETEQQKRERLVKEREEKEKAAREKEEKERKEKERIEEEKRAKEEAERKAKEEEERKVREEAERKAEEERKAQEEAERKAEEERKVKEEEEKRIAEELRAKEEAERKAKEEEERKAREEAERLEAERKAKEEAARTRMEVSVVDGFTPIPPRRGRRTWRVRGVQS